MQRSPAKGNAAKPRLGQEGEAPSTERQWTGRFGGGRTVIARSIIRSKRAVATRQGHAVRSMGDNLSREGGKKEAKHVETREGTVEAWKGTGYSKILLGTDGSKCSERAARHAVYLAESLGAKLFALNAVNVDRAFRTTGIHFSEALEELERAGRAALGSVKEIAEARGIKCEEMMVRGRPHKAIINASEEVEADLIIVGSVGMSSVERVLLGSESEKVLHHSRRPVLLVRDP
jgi:nucleotide-binding universal stress UspA family protein